MEKLWKIKGQFSGNLLDDVINVRGLSKSEFFADRDLTTLLQALQLNTLSAKQTILKHISAGNPIYIHGDYDVDGICATAILYKTFVQDLDYKNCFYFIPNRFEDGYGLSKESVDKINTLNTKKGPKLLITVDCGITAIDSTNYARKLGFEVIITDHHQPLESLPNADSIVWTDKLCGAGIILALSVKLTGRVTPDYLALAAIATVADIQKIVGINRTLVKQGLEILATTPPISMQKLFEVAALKTERFGTYEIGWVVGPRLNAAGRLESALSSLQLLLTQDPQEALTLALALNKANQERQSKTLETLLQAKASLNTDAKVLLSIGKTYHEGIIGLVAGKLAQEFYKPSIVLSQGELLSKGSARSIAGVDIVGLLRSLGPDLFEGLGGHPMACGFTIKNENIDLLRTKLAEASSVISEEDLIPKLEVDLEVPLGEIVYGWLKILKQFEPYGYGNPEIVLVSRGTKVSEVRVVGSTGTHLKLKFYDTVGGKYWNGIFFGGSSYAPLLTGKLVDIAFTIKENVYNGMSTLELQIKDLKIAS